MSKDKETTKTITFILHEKDGMIQPDFKSSGYHLTKTKDKEKMTHQLSNFLTDSTICYLGLMHQYGVGLEQIHKQIDMIGKVINKGDKENG